MADESRVDYPKFVLVGLMNYGPHIWTFDSATDVCMFLWGKYLPHYALFKDREFFSIKSGNVKELERQLSDDG